jgi:aquaporin Z
MKLFKKIFAEIIGTFGFVTFGCGMVVLLGLLNSGNQNVMGNYLIMALTFGFSFVAMAYSVGRVSNCHINPAVSFGVLIYNFLKPKDKRNFSFVEFLVYVIAQIIGAFLGCFVLWLLFGRCNFGANQTTQFLKDITKDYYAISAFAVEVLLSATFVFTFLGVTSQEKSERRFGVVLGLTLALVYLFGAPFTGGGINPARSLAPAIFAYAFNNNGVVIDELWIFMTAPLVGALIAAFLYWVITYTKEEKKEEAAAEEEKLEQSEEKENPETKPEVKKVNENKEVLPVVEESEPPQEDAKKLEIERVSFETKLENSSKDLKDKYETIKKELTSYGIKSRVSFEGDTYRLHKVKYAFVTIRGKSIKLCLKLDPKKYKDSTIPLKDESGKKKYESTPAVLKVRSDLSLKRALSLIDECIKDANINKKQ